MSSPLNISENLNSRKLKAHILSRSVAENFDDAKLEWSLERVCVTEEFGLCPCGVRIKEHCYLKNYRNGNTTWVGNVCVRKFMDINAGTLFIGLRKVRNNISARPNMRLIDYAKCRGYLYGDHEYKFLVEISERLKLSVKQVNWLQKINRRILHSIVVRRIPDPINITDDDNDSGLEN